MTTLVPLDAVLKVHYGAALKAESRDASGPFPVFGSSGQVGLHNEQLVDHPTLIIGRKGSVGRVTYAPEGGWPIDTAFFIELLQPDTIDLRYLYYALDRLNLAAHAITTSIPGLSRNDIYRSKIPLPPLDEQRRIAAILDKADGIRRKRQEALDEFHQLLSSAFLEMFGEPTNNPRGWEVVAIETLASSIPNAMAIGPFGSNLLSSDYTTEGRPVVFVRDIVSGRFYWKSNVFVSEAKFVELKSHRVRAGDVVATKMGTPPCIAAVYPEGMQEGIITADVIKMTPRTEICTSGFLAAMINSDYCKRQVERFTAGVTRPKVTLRDFKDLQVLLPPIEKQKEWDTFVESHARTRRRMEVACQQLEALSQTLNQMLFMTRTSSGIDWLGSNAEERALISQASSK